MADLSYTPLDQIDQIHADANAAFRTGKTKSIAYRKYLLLQLAYLVKDNEKAIVDALGKDLGRHSMETYILEINTSLAEIMEAHDNVESWAKPEKPPMTFNFVFMNPRVLKQPKGAVLIISPFNFPLWLLISPLAGALAAGNTVVFKPSEAAPHFASLMTELFPKYIEPAVVSVVNGAIPETSKLLALPWGHILYTDVELPGADVKYKQLGGKSPVFIDPSSDLDLAARRVMWGKFSNAGQTCVAPDYVLVPRSGQDAFIAALKKNYEQFWPETKTGEVPKDASRMIHAGAYKRVSGLLAASKGTVVAGGQTKESEMYIAPTIIKDVKWDDSLMSEELFGPLLPIVPIDSVEEGIAYVNANDHPLALYVFSQDDAYKQKVFDNTTSGSCAANETLLIAGVTGLPFGGIGPSGSGGYHTGKWGFDMFTHFRATIDTPGWIDKLLSFRFPPYTDKKAAMLQSRLGVKLPARPQAPPAITAAAKGGLSKWFLFALAFAVVGALTKTKSGLKPLLMWRK
ncbi:unnamed protein product [Mycena citricolor]|uniref:Aldehyde dehydrogenase n=1 Tax=Mycena citricolor TaxID=2018698 RepID=A0AAD2HMK8_9AGAR|nr:unnamed protein product [Mycena citricolor]